MMNWSAVTEGVKGIYFNAIILKLYTQDTKNLRKLKKP